MVFDPDAIGAGPREWLSDVPGGGKLIVQRAVGVDRVLGNGEALIEQGEHTGALQRRIVERSLG